MALTAKKVYAILKRQISDMEAKLNSPVRYRGTVATADLLPLNPDIGDMYNIESKSVYGEAGMNVAWNGVVWDTMGAPIDMSLYFTKEEAEAVIQRLVTEYFEKNPVKPGATTEQAQQIEQNKTDVASLKEDIDNLSSSKISKFYATNNGENHLADSDDGKIADMMVYGRSEQKSTTGAQLFDMSTAFAGWVGDDGTPRNDGTIGKADNIVSDYIPVESNTVYACNNNNNVFVWEYDSSKTLIKSDGQLNSENFTSSETAKYIVFAVSYSSAQTPDYIKTIMFNKGSSVLPWEPYTGGQPSPSPDYPQEIKSVVNPTVKVTNEDGLKVQSVTLNNITLNAIPVSSGGNVTINGQQYIADYVDVERGKLVRMVGEYEITGNENLTFTAVEPCPKVYFTIKDMSANDKLNVMCDKLKNVLFADVNRLKGYTICSDSNPWIRIYCTSWTSVDEAKNDLKKWKPQVQYVLATPVGIALTTEEIAALKELATYYPVTNISVNSEQLDGYTVFNYPISMENGWNYVKQQLNDNRDYIYDIDTKTQDIDTQAAEAYVNSEYAVALTELEV